MNPVIGDNPVNRGKYGLVLILLGCAFNALGQGQVNFNNRSTSGYPAPVVAPSCCAPSYERKGRMHMRIAIEKIAHGAHGHERVGHPYP